MLIKRDSHLLKNLFSLHSEVIKEQPQAFEEILWVLFDEQQN
jgi:hypothetical protein